MSKKKRGRRVPGREREENSYGAQVPAGRNTFNVVSR